MQHSSLSPSSAGRWLYCPGSVSMEKAFRETDRSEASMDGDAAHWVAAEALLGRGADPFPGRKAPNGVAITQEMVDAAMLYVAHVMSLTDGLGTVGTLVEEPVSIRRVHPDCWGTPDARYYDPGNKYLHIVDLKYGFGIVEPMDNEQLICYAIGSLDELAERLGVGIGGLDENITVFLHIVQPRAPHKLGPVRTWPVKGSDLRSWANRLEAAADEALGKNPKCVSGYHCKHCRAILSCQAANKAELNAIDVSEEAAPHQFDNDAAVSEYLLLKRAEAAIKNRLSAREGSLIAKIQSGEWVPGLSIERGVGRASWNKPIEEVVALGDVLGKDLRAPAAAITPAKARAKGVPAELVAAYSSTGVTGIKLIETKKSFVSKAFNANKCC